MSETYTAEDFARVEAIIANEDGGMDIDDTVLAALRIAQRVMTEGVIEELLMWKPMTDKEITREEMAVMMTICNAQASAIRDALTREEKAE